MILGSSNLSQVSSVTQVAQSHLKIAQTIALGVTVLARRMRF